VAVRAIGFSDRRTTTRRVADRRVVDRRRFDAARSPDANGVSSETVVGLPEQQERATP
jgi:hypothetical protein